MIQDKDLKNNRIKKQLKILVIIYCLCLTSCVNLNNKYIGIIYADEKQYTGSAYFVQLSYFDQLQVHYTVSTIEDDQFCRLNVWFSYKDFNDIDAVIDNINLDFYKDDIMLKSTDKTFIILSQNYNYELPKFIDKFDKECQRIHGGRHKNDLWALSCMESDLSNRYYYFGYEKKYKINDLINSKNVNLVVSFTLDNEEVTYQIGTFYFNPDKNIKAIIGKYK